MAQIIPDSFGMMNTRLIMVMHHFNDIFHMSFLAGTHVFKAFPAYTTTEL